MKAWEKFLQLQDEELGTETVQKWLKSLKVARFDAGNLYLEAKDSFQAIWFEEHMHAKAQAFLMNSSNRKIKIHVSLSTSSVNEKESKKSSKGKSTTFSAPFTFDITPDSLNPSCTLENFVQTENNKLLNKLLHELVEKPQVTLNPIYLHGGPGLGKTHLLMSLCHCLQQKGLKTLYARSETFTNHVVGAIRSGQMSQFRQTYRNIDVLLLDDVQVFSRKAATQEEFFHTFNTLHMGGKQIILSANCAPNELQLIEPRLVSRFEWGIVLQLEPFSHDEMLQVLNQKAKILDFPLPMRVSEFLIESFASSPKALIKALEALILRLHIDIHNPTAQLTTTFVKQVLADLLAEEEKLCITPGKIIQAVAEHYGIRTEDILGKAQSRDCALPRQMAMSLCRSQLKMPFMKIGDAFSRDHSTVMSSVKQIQQSLDDNDQAMEEAWHGIIKKLNNPLV